MNEPASAPARQLSPAEMAEASAKAAQALAELERVLAEGKRAQAKYDEFCSAHGIQPGVGMAKLLDPATPPRDRYILGHLLAELDAMDEKIRLKGNLHDITPKQTVGARALGSRLRI